MEKRSHRFFGLTLVFRFRILIWEVTCRLIQVILAIGIRTFLPPFFLGVSSTKTLNSVSLLASS